MLTFGVAALATVAIWVAEHGHKESDIHSLWEAFFFSISQLTTMSTSMANPVTRTGEVIVLLMDFYAITVVSTLAGMFGAYFYHRTDERRQAEASKNEGDS